MPKRQTQPHAPQPHEIPAELDRLIDMLTERDPDEKENPVPFDPGTPIYDQLVREEHARALTEMESVPPKRTLRQKWAAYWTAEANEEWNR